jgi:glyceraldehyde 3-phosphate dehydrogenase
MNVAINGFGRIGRAVFKLFLARNNFFKVVAVNDLTDTATLAHLLNHDTCYGRFKGTAEAGGPGYLVVNRKKYRVFSEKDPALLPWRELDVDIVIESTGRFRSYDEAGAHLKAGAKKVIISAPAKGDKVKTFVLGVNEEKIKRIDRILSMASCTTNCLAPVTEVIRSNFGIKKAVMTTVHSYTADQNIVDGPHKDLRRARAAAANIVPTTTGAAVAVTKTIPALKGSFDGMAIRVPTPVVSLCDIVYLTRKRTEAKKVNATFKKAARSARLKGILSVTEEELVSSDFIADPSSAIVDLPLTTVIGGDLLKVVAWYDNEWGYSNRLVDLCGYINKKRLF